MAYRRTDSVVRRLAARRDAILEAARLMAAEGGMGAVQIGPVAARAGIAAGTVYRYFPAKADLVAALVELTAEREVGAMRRAAAGAPGPLSALAAAIATFAARALRQRKLVWAVLAEPIDPEAAPMRLAFRRKLARELRLRIDAAMDNRLLPEQDAQLAAPALVGALLEGLVGPLAPDTASKDAAAAHEAVQTLTLLSLRALGVMDARARGIVVQTAIPASG
jgi:AcrR family transcriptional regulator